MKLLTRKNIFYFCIILYFGVCLYLNIKGTCFGVIPDGAGSAVCGYSAYKLLYWLIMPASLLVYPLLWLGVFEYLDTLIPHFEFFLFFVITIINTSLLFFLFQKISKKCLNKKV
jgi:hypothetical protein